MKCKLNKLTALLAAVALSVGLAACGGGSSKTVEPADITGARDAAMASYTAAAGDATSAETAADAAEAVTGAAGTPNVLAARAAATAARAAADAAKMAHDAITDGMTMAAANEKRDEAANHAKEANKQYLLAKAASDDVVTQGRILDQRDINDAREAAGKAVAAAKTAMDNAAMAATAAETARDNAKMQLDMAKAARTDVTAAETQYGKAMTAATTARTAANAAKDAYDAAKAAHEGIKDVIDGGMAAAAKTAQETAEAEQGKAETAEATAVKQKMAAETALGAATTAAGKPTLRLFMAANGTHVEDNETTTTVNEHTAHVASVGTAIAGAANATEGNQAGNNTAASATWPGDTVDNPTTTADEFSEGTLTISVNPDGAGVIPFELRPSRAAADLNNDGDMTDDGETRIINTAMKIADLGVFQGYDLTEDDGTDATGTNLHSGDGARAIVFTNKKQGNDSVLAVTGGAARSVKGQAVDAAQLSNVKSSGLTITGVTWTPTGEPPLTGTLTCGDSCNIVLGEDGAVTSISGYTFTGSRAAVTAVTAADATEDNNYLMFGLWLDETDNGATDTFGSFAFGGTNYAVNVADEVTGDASYSGKAAGAHHKTGEGVNWFDGDASLTAKFGTASAAGTISGSISNIRVGGTAVSDPIYLGQADLTTGSATFNGAAFMGAATAPGASTHALDGTWSGSFFGATEDDDDTDVNESHVPPLAAAGTFGVTKSTGTGDDMVVESYVGAFGAHK